MFAPLLDRIRGKLSHWANSLLSYAGKITLINSVIFGLQNFWGSSVLLPKGVVKKIQKMCKDFLWGIDAGQRRFVFKSWDSFCLPRKEGGVGIKEILSWNKSQLLIWIRKLVIDSPTIWVKWIKAYVLKGVDIWHFQLTSAYSWAWSSLIDCRDSLIQVTGSSSAAQNLLAQPDFKGIAYDLFRHKGSVFSQHKTLGDTLIYPKHVVIGILAVQNKLPTIDNLCRRGLVLINRRVLCKQNSESSDHLFFDCPFSANVCRVVAVWLRITVVTRWRRIFSWFKKYNRGNGCGKRLRRCALVCTIYHIWRERNKRIFQDVSSEPSTLIWRIKYLVFLRVRGNASAYGF
ncbi:uncharacterized protein LOC141590229 [Silene latifolia]|uniref:uncharacterized protein LOC141590229 n=1 Tax=Silene latifolia TaxID=37657 RepID=UPI003D76C10D